MEKTPDVVENGYSWKIGFVYVFNLIVGAGLLALPKAFAETGWILGSLCLCLLALISYMTVTFIIEAMSISNAFQRYKATQIKHRFHMDSMKTVQNALCDKDIHGVHNEAADCDDRESPSSEANKDENKASSDTSIPYGTSRSPHVNTFDTKKETTATKIVDEKTLNFDGKSSDIYEITTNVELGEMSKMFFYKPGVLLYYISVCMYLYGGLSVYSAAVSKSLTTVVCGDAHCFQKNLTDPCKNVSKINVYYMYRIMLAVFVVLICPFAYFKVSDTKILQIFTTTYRWLSMLTMIILTLVKIGQHDTVKTSPKLFNFSNLPNFFGVAIYSFMCQHSIPAVLTPVKNKRRIGLLVVLDFICVIVFYGTILMTGVFAFPPNEIQDLYTLNFTSPNFLKYMLQLFPVFTLSANFPILAIVLGANLKKLILTNTEKKYGFFLNRILFPTVVILPPIAVAYSTSDVGMLVGFTGTYAGSVLQYVIPCLLVYCGRRKMVKLFGVYNNKYQSPFRHQIWIVLVMAWYFVCLVFVTYNNIKGK